MASDTAWMVGLTTPGLPEAHTSYGNALARPHLDDDMFPDWAVISPRALSQPINDLRGLGIEIDENNAVLKGLRSAVLTGYSLYMLYNAVAALRRAEAIKETGLAVAETVVAAFTLRWVQIAEAAGAAIVTYAAFQVGERFGSGEWTLPAGDLREPTNRRIAARLLEEKTKTRNPIKRALIQKASDVVRNQ